MIISISFPSSDGRSIAIHPRRQERAPPNNPPDSAVGMTLALMSCTMGNLLWLIIVILLIMWLGGFAFHVGGSLIHLLLVIAVIVLIFQLITGRRAL
jgi:hypothetical protein